MSSPRIAQFSDSAAYHRNFNSDVYQQFGSVLKTQADHASKLANFVFVTDFGATGDGLTDDTRAIQRAIDSLPYGGTVIFPEGTYKTTSAITVTTHGLNLVGQTLSAKVVTNHATADVFTVGDGTNEVRSFTVTGLAVDASVAKSAGYAFNCSHASRCHFRDCLITRPEDALATPNLKHGIYFDRFDYCTVMGCTIIVSGTCIACRGNADQSFGAGLFIGDGCKLYCNNHAGSLGVHCGGGAGGVYITDADIIACENNVYLSTSLAGTNNREVFIGGTTSLDSAGFCNVNAESGACSFLSAKGIWMSSAGATNPDGVAWLTNGSGTHYHHEIIGCRIYNNNGGGISINGVPTTIVGNSIHDNANGLGGHGIDIAAATNDFTISGNTVLRNGIVAKGWGVKIVVGSNNYIVVGNNVRDNLQGNLSDGGGPNKTLGNNLLT